MRVFLVSVIWALALQYASADNQPHMPEHHTYSPRYTAHATPNLASTRSVLATTYIPAATSPDRWEAVDLDNSSYSNPITRAAATVVAKLHNGFYDALAAVTNAVKRAERRVDASILRRAAQQPHTAPETDAERAGASLAINDGLADYYRERGGQPRLVTGFWGDNPHYEWRPTPEPARSHWQDLAQPRPRPSPVRDQYRAEVVPTTTWDFGWDSEPAVRYVPVSPAERARAAQHKNVWLPALPSLAERVRGALAGEVCEAGAFVGDNAVLHKQTLLGTEMGWDGAKHPIYKTEVQYIRNPFAPMSLIDASFYERPPSTAAEQDESAVRRLPVRPPGAFPEGEVVAPGLARLLGSYWRPEDVHTYSQGFRERLAHALQRPEEALTRPVYVPFRTQDIDYGKAYSQYSRHLAGTDVLRASVQTLQSDSAPYYLRAAVVSHLTASLACAVFIIYHFTHLFVARGNKYPFHLYRAEHIHGAAGAPDGAASLSGLRAHFRRHRVVYSLIAVAALTVVNICAYAVAPLLLYLAVTEFISGTCLLLQRPPSARAPMVASAYSPLDSELVAGQRAVAPVASDLAMPRGLPDLLARVAV